MSLVGYPKAFPIPSLNTLGSFVFELCCRQTNRRTRTSYHAGVGHKSIAEVPARFNSQVPSASRLHKTSILCSVFLPRDCQTVFLQKSLRRLMQECKERMLADSVSSLKRWVFCCFPLHPGLIKSHTWFHAPHAVMFVRYRTLKTKSKALTLKTKTSRKLSFRQSEGKTVS